MISARHLNSVIFPLIIPFSPPSATTPTHLIFRNPNILRPFSVRLILRIIMTDSNSRYNALAQLDCAENGGASEDVSAKYAEIIIVRHGETEWNSVHRIQGHLDVELNDVGRQQAVAVADRLSKEPKIDAVYSSDLKRAFETAEVIAKGCGVPEVIKEPDLRERNLGALQGLNYHEISKVNPIAYKAFVSKQGDQEIPGGGESLIQLYDRCTSALPRIAEKHKGSD